MKVLEKGYCVPVNSWGLSCRKDLFIGFPGIVKSPYFMSFPGLKPRLATIVLKGSIE